MSDNVIKDGTGTGNRAGVTSNNRLLTLAHVQPQVYIQTLNGNHYVIGMPERTISTVDTEHPIMYINPNTSGVAFFATRFVASVKNEEPVLFKVRIFSAPPTANRIVAAAGNSNILSTKSANLTVNYWDGVGTGMSTTFTGIQTLTTYVARGVTDIPLDGSQVWGLNSHVLITVECEATNKFTFAVTGWQENV